MIYIKTPEEIRIIKEGGRRLSIILQKLLTQVKPGVSTGDIENLANKLIEETGGRSAFKNYNMGGGIFFPSTLCISINDEVVHGPAWPARTIKAGDIVDLDIGMEWPVDPELRREFKAPVNIHSSQGGFFTDMCATVGAGKISREANKLLQVTKECLNLGIKAVKAGAKLNDIGRAVENKAQQHHYGIVKDLVGHGVGYEVHEKPDVFNFTIPEGSPDNLTLKTGMVIAIEPMINIGDERVRVADNDYTILTADGSLSAHFEHTIAVTDDGYDILTK